MGRADLMRNPSAGGVSRSRFSAFEKNSKTSSNGRRIRVDLSSVYSFISEILRMDDANSSDGGIVQDTALVSRLASNIPIDNT